MYREDYERAGFRMLSSGDETGARSASQSVLFCMLLLIIAGVPAYLGLTSAIYLIAALALGAVVYRHGHALSSAGARRARRGFISDIDHLPSTAASRHSVLTKT